MAVKKNLVIDQGSTFSNSIVIVNANGDPRDVTNCNARAQFRKFYTSTNGVSFTCNLVTGVLTLSLTANQSAAVAAGRYVYDAEIVDAEGKVKREVEGIVTVTPEVTKS